MKIAFKGTIHDTAKGFEHWKDIVFLIDQKSYWLDTIGRRFNKTNGCYIGTGHYSCIKLNLHSVEYLGYELNIPDIEEQ